MRNTISRRIALVTAALFAAGSTVRGRPTAAAPGDPLLLGKLNRAGRRPTQLKSLVGVIRSIPRAALEVENNGAGVGLHVRSSGRACITTYGQLGATAIIASSNDGYAVVANGLVQFDFAGVARVTAGQASARVKLASGNVNFPEGSQVLATLQGDGGPGVGVRYVKRLEQTPPDFEALEIVLTAPAAQAVDVAFWVFYLPAGGGALVPA